MVKQIFEKPVGSEQPRSLELRGKQGSPTRTLQIVAGFAIIWAVAMALTMALRSGPVPSAPTLGPPGGDHCHQGEPPDEGGESPGDNNSCSFVLVESLPLDMPYAASSPEGQPIAQTWGRLLEMARESVHVASYYWSLTGADVGVNDSSSQLGEEILKKLESLPARNVSLLVVGSIPTLALASEDLRVLERAGAQVRRVNLGRLTQGVLHSKFWVVDMRHIYLGSANMDWRSLTQVKELGAVIYNCSRLARDLWKIFQTYWDLGTPGAAIPPSWPQNYSTSINSHRPLDVDFNGTAAEAFLAASPPALCPQGRTHDLAALLQGIREAQEFVHISVMEYFPTTRFQQPPRYWPVIDNALRAAAFNRNVPIRLLVSCGVDTDPSMFAYLRSLRALHHPEANVTVEVKVFIVPIKNHSNVPFGRLNHSKYMVTETVVYIGTSNWSEDYFSNTAGVGLVLRPKASDPQGRRWAARQLVQRVFDRDWSSDYAVSLEDLPGHPDCACT
ncbi:5'-3' exonuclease PLD4 [Ornithorhynchus anatinus]|uniref:Phospholipase D family member 4 n=1 Tax=Ornithorhynchus anatinus TaxID=9258 RepID=F6QAV3_ORNAN|nr:5'-3' exonuclease PLD4 [Ornithorhynchus anatinus]